MRRALILALLVALALSGAAFAVDYFAVSGTAKDSSGNALVSPSIKVYVASNGNTATIYSSGVGASKSNPFTAASNGTYSFWVTAGTYRVVATKSGAEYTTIVKRPAGKIPITDLYGLCTPASGTESLSWDTSGVVTCETGGGGGGGGGTPTDVHKNSGTMLIDTDAGAIDISSTGGAVNVESTDDAISIATHGTGVGVTVNSEAGDTTVASGGTGDVILDSSNDVTITAGGSGAATLQGPSTMKVVVNGSNTTVTGPLVASSGLTGPVTGNVTGNLTGLASQCTVLTTPRAIYGNNFDGSAALTQVIASTYGGTGNGFAKITGPTTSEKTFTLPNASATILTDNAAVTTAQGGLGANNASATGVPVFAAGTATVTTPTGSGAPVLATSPTLVTPTLGVATATSVSGVLLGGGSDDADSGLVRGSNNVNLVCAEKATTGTDSCFKYNSSDAWELGVAGTTRFTASATQISFTSSNNLDRELSFDGSSFGPGTQGSGLGWTFYQGGTSRDSINIYGYHLNVLSHLGFANGNAGSADQKDQGQLWGGQTKTLTDNSATAFVRLTMGSGSTIGGRVIYQVGATDGTDFQSRSGLMVFSAVDKAGTITCTVSTVAGDTEVVAVSSGTLVNNGFTCADAGSNLLELRANFDSSFGSPTDTMKWNIEVIGVQGTLLVTAQ